MDCNDVKFLCWSVDGSDTLADEREKVPMQNIPTDWKGQYIACCTGWDIPCSKRLINNKKKKRMSVSAVNYVHWFSMWASLQTHFTATHFPQPHNHLALPERLWAITKKLRPAQSDHCEAAFRPIPVWAVPHSAFPSKSGGQGQKSQTGISTAGSWIYSWGLRGIYKGLRVQGLQ